VYNNPNWNNIQNPPFNWVKSAEKIIKSERIPQLSGDSIYIASDYSGQHKSSRYETYSVLFLDMTKIYDWELARRGLRKIHLPDQRRLSYKGLGDKHKQDFLVPFLQESSLLHGVLVTFVVNKSVKVLCADEQNFASILKTYNLSGSWKYRGFEQMLRIINFVCILSAGLAKPKQEISWITDEDELMANDNKSKDVQYMIGKFASLYSNNLASCTLALGSAVIDPGDRLEEDIIALADLSAGAVCDMVNTLSNHSGGKIFPELAIPYSKSFSDKTEIILDWYFHKAANLSKAVVLIETHGKGYSVSKYEMKY
jgi:hypothetical protein